MRKLIIFALLSVFLLAACGGSDDDAQDDSDDNNPTSAPATGEPVVNDETTDSDASEAQGGQFILTITGQVDHLGENNVLLENIVLASDIPVTGRLVYAGQTRQDEPRYTLHLEAFNVERPNRTQVDLLTDGKKNNVIFSELELGLHQPMAGKTFTFPNDLTGDSYGEMVDLAYELWTVTDWPASFDHFEPETITGTVTITQLDILVTGSFALTIPVLSDSIPRIPVGEIQLSVQFSDVPLENPDEMPADES